MTRTRTTRHLVSALAVTATAGLLAACGSSTTTASSSSSAALGALPVDAALHAALPAAIKSAGAIHVGIEAQYPPFESLADDNVTIVGLDADLGAAIGQVLGVKWNFSNASFDSLLPSLKAGRYDLVQAAVTDTKVREAQYDFVDYFMTGQSIVVKKGNPKGIHGISDLCGHPVAVLRGSTQESMLNGFNGNECKANPISVTSLQTDKDALLQVQTGRADASFTQDAVGAYNTKTIGDGNQFEVANSSALLPTPVGIVFDKTQSALRDDIKAAIEKIIASGEYDKILAKYGLTGGAVKTITVNGAVG